MFEIRLNGQLVATCIKDIVKPFVETLINLVGVEFEITTKEIVFNNAEQPITETEEQC